MLENPYKNGRYNPDVILGISNGGLIVADLLARELFTSKPVLTLWANRSSNSRNYNYWYFDNDYNDATIAVIKKNFRHEKIKILLIDDHLGTGTTVLQAKEYLLKKLKDKLDILFIPLVSKRIAFNPEVENMLPYNYTVGGEKIIEVDKDGFFKIVNTESKYFPYFNKSIH